MTAKGGKKYSNFGCKSKEKMDRWYVSKMRGATQNIEMKRERKKIVSLREWGRGRGKRV